jgi:hypothetical protein
MACCKAVSGAFLFVSINLHVITRRQYAIADQRLVDVCLSGFIDKPAPANAFYWATATDISPGLSTGEPI